MHIDYTFYILKNMTLKHDYLPTCNSVQSYIVSYCNILQLYSKYSYKCACQGSAPLGLIYPSFIFGYEGLYKVPVSGAYTNYRRIGCMVL
jgi:hypothetical protein